MSENIPQFWKLRVAKKDLKDNKDNSLHLGRKFARIFVLEHYLFPLTLFLELRFKKSVRFSEQVMSADKYPSIFSLQMATIQLYTQSLRSGSFIFKMAAILQIPRVFPCASCLGSAKAVQCPRHGPKIGGKSKQIPCYSPACPRG